jgi:hypothetical protein
MESRTHEPGGLMASKALNVTNRKSVILTYSEGRQFVLFVRILIVRSASGIVDAL